MATQVTKVVKFNPIFIESKFKWEVREWPDLKETAIESSRIEIPEIDAFWWIQINPKALARNQEEGNDRSFRKAFNFSLKMRSSTWKGGNYEVEVQCYETERYTKKRQKVFSFDFKKIDQAFISVNENIYSEQGSSICSAFRTKVFEFKVTIKFLGSSVVRSKQYDPFAANSEVLTNVRSLMSNTIFSDFIFIVKDKEFKVHRNILAAASSVMLKMFTSNMEESRTNRCKVDHVEPEVFEKLLEYIYKGKLPENFKDYARDLYAAADYYGIDKLKEAARIEVTETLEASNAIDTYKWACQYDLLELKADSWQIVKRDVLKIFFPMKYEPLTFKEIQDVLIEKKRQENFWKNFKF